MPLRRAFYLINLQSLPQTPLWLIGLFLGLLCWLMVAPPYLGLTIFCSSTVYEYAFLTSRSLNSLSFRVNWQFIPSVGNWGLFIQVSWLLLETKYSRWICCQALKTWFLVIWNSEFAICFIFQNLLFSS